MLLEFAHRGSYKGVLFGKLLSQELAVDDGHLIRDNDISGLGGIDSS